MNTSGLTFSAYLLLIVSVQSVYAHGNLSVVKRLNVLQWKRAAQVLVNNPEINSVLVQNQFDIDENEKWRFELVRNEDGTFYQITYEYGKEVRRTPFFELKGNDQVIMEESKN